MESLTNLIVVTLLTAVAVPALADGGSGNTNDTIEAFLKAERIATEVEPSLPQIEWKKRWWRPAWLPQGKVRLKQGKIHQMTKVRADVSWAEFKSNLDIADWGSNLALFRGGELTRHLDTRAKAPEGRWASFASKLRGMRFVPVPGGSDARVVAQDEQMDLTGTNVRKRTVIVEGDHVAKARWNVFEVLDNTVFPRIRTTKTDDGFIEFRSVEKGRKVEITIGSRHQLRLGRFDGRVINALAAIPLKLYMKACAYKHKKTGEGRREKTFYRRLFKKY
jgi:hypothetical protein